MQVAGATAAGTDSEVSSEVSFRAGRESGSLLMPHVDPIDRFSSPQRVGKAVQGVADHTIDAFYARLLQGFDQVFRSSLAHNSSPWWAQGVGTGFPGGGPPRVRDTAEALSAKRGADRFAATAGVLFGLLAGVILEDLQIGNR